MSHAVNPQFLTDICDVSLQSGMLPPNSSGNSIPTSKSLPSNPVPAPPTSCGAYFGMMSGYSNSNSPISSTNVAAAAANAHSGSSDGSRDAAVRNRSHTCTFRQGSFTVFNLTKVSRYA